jgi:tRNA-(ms[2]io[6]A)-hydroxylase
VGLVDRLRAPLAGFYASLATAESRHAGLYFRLADRRGSGVAARLAELAAIEAELATSPDPDFRFHSGTPSLR